MVSLFDISTQKPLWNHLSTGVPTLDSMLGLQSDALLDWQSVPANTSSWALLCSMMASHLQSSDSAKVVVLETINAFPWSVLEAHPAYDASWVTQDRIVSFQVPTFAQLYAFFAFLPLQRQDPGSVLIFVTNFHECVEFYRLQASATHEEVLLKHQIDKNRCFIENLQKVTEEGCSAVNLPPVPSVARENPYNKIQAQINGLISIMSEYAFKNSAVIVLIGHLEPKYKPVMAKPPVSADTSFRSSQVPMSQTPSISSFSNKDTSRLTLMPVTFGPPNADKPNFAESKVTARLVFYNDWFHKSPYFKRECKKRDGKYRFFVSVAKVFNLNGINNINEPVYFHYQKLPFMKDAQQKWLVDLSEPEQENSGLASLIQESIISSTQIPSRDMLPPNNHVSNSFVEPHRRKARKISIPSSPPHLTIVDDVTYSQHQILSGKENIVVESEHSEESGHSEESEHSEESAEKMSESDVDADSENESDSQSHVSSEEMVSAQEEVPNEGLGPGLRKLEETEVSFIEGSDVESTGTLFEDMDNSEPEWMMRHS